MTKRKINKNLLRMLVKDKGIAETAVEANCSTSLIQKLTQDGYETLPKIAKIDGLCFALNKSLDELFPFDRQEEEEKSA